MLSMNNIKGWVDHREYVDEVEEETFGAFGSVASDIVGSGRGKDSFSFRAFEKVGLKYPVLHQKSAPSCVAFACAGGVNLLKALEIANGDNEEYKNNTAQMDLYWGSRVIIGKNRLKGRGGSLVSWCVRYLHEYGALLEQAGYPNGLDLTYDPAKCVRWGNDKGAPKTLMVLAKEHPIGVYSRVKSWEEFRDSLYNHCPVMFGSRYGFSSSTDKDGFCKQNTTWSHAMLGIGMSDNAKRPCGIIANSWGSGWLRQNGNKYGIPKGCFCVDADIIDKIMKNGDCWSISNFSGYKVEKTKPNFDIAW